MLEQGYQKVEEFIGLGQPYIKYNPNPDLENEILSPFCHANT